MNKSKALQFLAQVAQDFMNTLPPSARGPFQKSAQEAITAIEKTESAPESGNGQVP